jgi:hypothetical protein
MLESRIKRLQMDCDRCPSPIIAPAFARLSPAGLCKVQIPLHPHSSETIGHTPAGNLGAIAGIVCRRKPHAPPRILRPPRYRRRTRCTDAACGLPASFLKEECNSCSERIPKLPDSLRERRPGGLPGGEAMIIADHSHAPLLGGLIIEPAGEPLPKLQLALAPLSARTLGDHAASFLSAD